MRLPDFEAWAIFAKVADLGSFARAAEAVQLSKPTVSKAITRLEQSLGVSLFNRTSRQLSLTEEGRDLLGYANRMLGEAQSAEAVAREGTATPSGQIRLAAPMSFGLRHVAPLLPDFLRDFPEIDVTIDFSDAPVDLVAEGFDVALRIARLGDSSLRARRLCDVRILMVATPGWLDTVGRPTQPTDLEAHKSFIYTNTSAPGTIRLREERTGREVFLAQTGRVRANNAEGFLPSVLAGVSYGIFPEFMIHEALERGELEVILPEWQIPPIALYLVMPPSPLRAARVSVFMNYLTDRFLTPPWAIGQEA